MNGTKMEMFQGTLVGLATAALACCLIFLAGCTQSASVAGGASQKQGVYI